MTLSVPILDDRDFASLTYGDRLSLTKALSKSYGLMVGLVVLAGFFMLLVLGGGLFSISGFSLEALRGDSPALPAGGFLAFVLVVVLSQFMVVGLNCWLLLLVEGRQPEGGPWPALLLPWSRFGGVFMCILLWLLLSVAYQVVFSMLTQAPVLGQLLTMPGLGLILGLIASLVLSMITNCALLYIADRIEEVTPGQSVIGTMRIIRRTFLSWLGAMATLLAFYLPGLAMVIMSGTWLITGGGRSLGTGVLMAAGLLAVLLAAIFGFFFLAVTYRHTKGRLAIEDGPAPAPLN